MVNEQLSVAVGTGQFTAPLQSGLTVKVCPEEQLANVGALLSATTTSMLHELEFP
jgi:hypothetical protein